MKKIHFIYLGVIVILCLALGAVIWRVYPLQQKEHYAVYLTSGDLYFGELRSASGPMLYNAYVLARSANGAEIIRFSDAFWGPTGPLYLNEKNILWTAKISEEKWSEIDRTIDEAKK